MTPTIPEPPTSKACASCASVLHWLYSQRRSAWVAFVPLDETTLRVHPCKTAQDPRVWRDVRQGDPPNDDYLAAKAELKTSSEGEPA